MYHDICLNVNGNAHALHVESRKSLADAVREDCCLTGTHLGCEHGVCGACTVLLDGQPVRSCLLFAVQCEDAEIRTVESLQSGNDLSPLQDAFHRHHALQCGFCTPGFLMLLTGVAESGQVRSRAEVKTVIASNLCRCTGYQGIVAAATEVLLPPRADPDL